MGVLSESGSFVGKWIIVALIVQKFGGTSVANAAKILSAAQRIALTGAGRCDLIQPDVGWCGGLTELVRIADMAEAAGMLVIPHGPSIYIYHSVSIRENSQVPNS